MMQTAIGDVWAGVELQRRTKKFVYAMDCTVSVHKTVVYFRAEDDFKKSQRCNRIGVRPWFISAEDDARQQGMVARQSMTRK
jgi:hypothetical protein